MTTSDWRWFHMTSPPRGCPFYCSKSFRGAVHHLQKSPSTFEKIYKKLSNLSQIKICLSLIIKHLNCLCLVYRLIRHVQVKFNRKIWISAANLNKTTVKLSLQWYYLWATSKMTGVRYYCIFREVTVCSAIDTQICMFIIYLEEKSFD